MLAAWCGRSRYANQGERVVAGQQLMQASTGRRVAGRDDGPVHRWPPLRQRLAGYRGHGGLIPAGLAAFEWAASLSVSAYWAHPQALAAFPAPELAWMVVSPLALAAAVIAAATIVRRAELPPRLLAFEVRLGVLACVVTAVFRAGCGCWVAAGGQRGLGLARAGLIDVAGVAVMALALAVAGQAARTARVGLRSSAN